MTVYYVKFENDKYLSFKKETVSIFCALKLHVRFVLLLCYTLTECLISDKLIYLYVYICNAYIIWTSTHETLSLGDCEQRMRNRAVVIAY